MKKMIVLICLLVVVAGCNTISKKNAFMVRDILKANIEDCKALKKGGKVNLDLTIKLNEKGVQIIEKSYNKKKNKEDEK